MNRRDFLRLSSLALASAGLPLTLLSIQPKTHIPAGWVREVQQYMVTDDIDLWRYDVVARSVDGNETQCYVELAEPAGTENVEARRAAAKFGLEHFLQKQNLIAIDPKAATQFHLRLPRNGIPAAYI